MRSSRYYYILAIALVMSVICVSCRQELCYDHYPSMDITFSWEQEWERDYGMNHYATWDPRRHRYEYEELRPDVPEWVKMVRYFDGDRLSENFSSPDGKRLEVDEEDDFSLLFYNGDTEYIILSDMASLNDVRATATTRTRSGSSLQAMQELYHVTRTTNSPDVIYSAYMEHVSGFKSHEVKPMPVKMQPLVFTYLVTFEFEQGIEHVSLARGALGGMADGVYLRTGVTTDETSIILFDCTIHEDACRCQVRSFGIPGFPDSYFGRGAPSYMQRPYTLKLELKLKSGKSVEFDYDISDQIKNQPRGGVIKVGGIRVEDDEGPGATQSGGFSVDVSGWNDDIEEIDLPIHPKNNR